MHSKRGDKPFMFFGCPVLASPGEDVFFAGLGAAAPAATAAVGAVMTATAAAATLGWMIAVVVVVTDDDDGRAIVGHVVELGQLFATLLSFCFYLFPKVLARLRYLVLPLGHPRCDDG
jgi:hypothetical protein